MRQGTTDRRQAGLDPSASFVIVRFPGAHCALSRRETAPPVASTRALRVIGERAYCEHQVRMAGLTYRNCREVQGMRGTAYNNSIKVPASRRQSASAARPEQ